MTDKEIKIKCIEVALQLECKSLDELIATATKLWEFCYSFKS